MATKIAAVMVVALAMFLMMNWQTDALAIQRRDAPTETSTVSSFDDLLANIKNELEGLAKNVADNPLYQNVTKAVKDFQEKIQSEGQKLVDKINSKSTN